MMGLSQLIGGDNAAESDEVKKTNKNESGNKEEISIEIMTSAEVTMRPAEDLSSVQRYHYIEKAYEDGIITNINDRNSFLYILEALNYERGLTADFKMIEITFKRAIDLSFHRGRNYFLPVIPHFDQKVPRDKRNDLIITLGQFPVECVEDVTNVVVTARPGDQINVLGYVARPINNNKPGIYTALRQVINLNIPGQFQVSPNFIREAAGSSSLEVVIAAGRENNVYPVGIEADGFNNIIFNKVIRIGGNIATEIGRIIDYYLFHTSEYIKNGYGFAASALSISAAYTSGVLNGKFVDFISKNKDIFNENLLIQQRPESTNIAAKKDKVEVEPQVPIIEHLTNVKIDDYYDLLNLGYEVFLYDRISHKFGVDSAAAKKYLSFLQERKRNIDLSRMVEKKQIRELYEQNIILFLLEKKLGDKRYTEIIKVLKAKAYSNLEVILSVLTPAERTIIGKEKVQYEASIKALAGNNCQHIKLMKRVRQEVNPKVANEMINNEVKKYFSETIEQCKKNNKMISCNNCKFDIICPHYIELISKLAGGIFNVNLREVLAPYLADIVGGAYYCRICNELVTTIDVLGSLYIDFDASLFSSMEDPLVVFLTPEVSSICRFLIAKTKDAGGAVITLPMQKIVKGVISGIYKYMIEVEKQLLKARTNSAVENENRKVLFTAIYTYAFLSNMCIATNLDKQSKINLYLQAAGRSGNEVTLAATSGAVDILKTAVSNILFTKNIYISKIKNITPEFIKDKVLEAFKIIAAAKGAAVLQLSDGESDLFNTIINDPLFLLAFDLNMIAENRKKVGRFYIVERFNDILGQDLKKMKEAAESKKRKKIKDDPSTRSIIYEKMKVPVGPKQSIDFFNNLKKINFKGVSAADLVDIYKRAEIGEYWAASTKLLSFFTTDKYLSGAEQLATYSVASENLEQYRKFVGCKNGVVAPFVEFINFNRLKTRDSAGLAASYDAAGRSHKFDIFVVKAAEIKRQDLIDAISAGKNLLKDKDNDIVINDRKCSVCGILWSKAYGPIDHELEEKIVNILREKADIESILRFYENRCPAAEDGFQHKLVSGRCSVCGFMKDNVDQKFSREFYLKYRKNFLKDKDAEMYGQGLIAADDSKAAAEANKKSVLGVKFGKIESESDEIMALVVSAAKLYNVDPASLQFIGMADERKYDELISRKLLNVEVVERYDFRSLLLSSYCKILITEYNQLRFRIGAESDILSENLVKLINESGVKKHELSALAGELMRPPSLIHNLKISDKENNGMVAELPAADLPINFYFKLFLELCIFIHSAGKKLSAEKDKLVRSYAEYIVKRIIRQDELRSKAGRFNWNVFKADELLLAEEDKKDSNFDEDAGVETSEDMKSAELESTAGVMKNSFDIDVDMDEGEVADDVMEDSNIAELD